MKKRLFLLLVPVFFATTRIDSTEIPFELSAQDRYQLNYKEYSIDFRTVPSNPNVYSEIPTYLDKELTQVDSSIKPDQSFQIVAVDVKSTDQLVFQLADKSYILADPKQVYDDIRLNEEKVDKTYWLKKEFQVYTSPIANQAKKVTTRLQSYSPVKVTEIVETHLARFAQIEGVGWVELDYLSATDNRIEAVQELLNKKYSSDNLSIYIKQLSTQYTAGVNQDKLMYAASVTKLPTLYYAQFQLYKGSYDLSQGLQYVKETEDFKGAYDPEGSGSLPKSPDNAHYTIEDLINRVAKESDNVASNILAYYATNQFDADFYGLLTPITKRKWDMEDRQASAEMAGLVMEAIYYQGGYVLGSLQATNFDNQRISRDIDVPVAHKIGDAYDFRHDVALVYADSPFVLSIFTENSDYDTISQIANDVYGILQ